MQVLFINNAGGGFAERVTVEAGTTILQFFNKRIGGDIKNYQVRVNREGCEQYQVLENGDRITITPTKVEGA